MTHIEALKLAREVLGFYAVDENYFEIYQNGIFRTTHIEEDRGKKAKDALQAIDTALKSGEQPVFMLDAQSMPDIPLFKMFDTSEGYTATNETLGLESQQLPDNKQEG